MEGMEKNFLAGQVAELAAEEVYGSLQIICQALV